MKIFYILLLILLASSTCCAAERGKDYKDYYVTLNSGYKMPLLGLGTWTLNNNEAEQCVYEALKSGYRLIDTARYYGNEAGVGRGVRRAINAGIVRREDVFITTKILPGGDPDGAINSCNETLGLEYIDLMLIHQPGLNDGAAYRALERGVKSGTIRSIGISNYYTPEDFERIIKDAEIMPAVLQNENHIYYQNTAMQKYVKQYGTVIESWYPLGGRGHTQELFNNKIIKAIAKSHGKTPAQIIIRWQIQAGYITIPGSKNLKHINENFNIFDFALSDREMQSIYNLDKGRRYENW